MNHIVLTLVFLLPATSGTGCTVADWTHFSGLKKYFIYHGRTLIWTEAQLYCERLGGQLLVIPDKNTDDVLKDYLKRAERFAKFLGLSNVDSEKFQWVDGTPVNFTKWQTGQPPDGSDKHCVVFEPWNDGTWKTGDCGNAKYHFCESKDPCAPRPVLSFDDGEMLENGEVTLTKQGVVIVGCFLRGFPEDVIEVQVSCGDTGNVGTGQKLVTRPFVMDWKMHEKTCICQSTRGDGKKDQSESTILFMVSPICVDEEDDGQLVTTQEGVGMEFSFDIYSNPKPTQYELMRHGNNVSQDIYTVKIEPKDERFLSSVSISMVGQNINNSGPYVLTIDNEIEPILEFHFTLNITDELARQPRPPRSPGGWSLLYFLQIAAGLLILIALLLLCIGGWYTAGLKKRASGNSKQNSLSYTIGPEKLPEIPNEILKVEENHIEPEVVFPERDSHTFSIFSWPSLRSEHDLYQPPENSDPVDAHNDSVW